MERGAGILMPVSALPCKYGIGGFGAPSFRFVDFLKKSGQRYWQILPLVQTGYGDSPYQTVCDYSLNPYFIDLETLFKKGLLTKRELEAQIDKSPKIDYGVLYEKRYEILRKAFSRFDVSSPSFTRFLRREEIKNYAVFMAIKGTYNCSLQDFPLELKRREKAALGAFEKDKKDEIRFWAFLQFELASEWKDVKKYAKKNGISIIGDLPLYVAADSVDVWVNPSLFEVNEDLAPVKIAGVPPDYFCADGQLWGNPVYKYSEHEKDDYLWWKNRVKRSLTVYDYVRIDHFRGLDRFWSVDAGAQNARGGEWVKANGYEILKDFIGGNVIVEDLGLIDDGVRELIEKLGFPNMKVLDFAFDGDFKNPYLPWNVPENCVYYTGTHDNDTALALIENADAGRLETIKKQVKNSLDYLEIYKDANGKYALCEEFCDIVYASRANLAMVPMHDLLLLNNDYRINEPGTVNNWVVRYRRRLFTNTLAELLKRKVKRFER